MKQYLDMFVVEQEEAKLAVSLACWLHLCRLRLLAKAGMESVHNLVIPEKSNIVLYGPTGTGKTYILKTIAQALGIPFVHFDASAITAPGHKGEEATRCIADLYEISKGSVSDAERGIVFLDEIDKLAFHEGHGRGTKLSHSAQASLLRIIEGTDVIVQSQDKKEDVVVNTTNILFVAAGTFPGLHEEKESKKRQVGFRETSPQRGVGQFPDNTKKFVQYGLTSEFVGRFSHFVPLHALSRSALYDILTKMQTALVKQYCTIAEECGIRLTFPEHVLYEIVDEVIVQGTGARALKSVFERRFMQLFFHLPTWEKEGVAQEKISDEILRGAIVSPVVVQRRNHARHVREELEE
jgi:ATP-dependent Clp protease ATP-binding subunit ClpX